MSGVRYSCIASIIACALAAAAASGAESAEEPLRAALAECRARLDPELDAGFERIAAKCPALPEALERSAWEAWLPQTWRDPRNDLSSGSLAELGVLIERESYVTPLRETPARADLTPVLAELAREDEERASLATRLREWLHVIFEREQAAREESWLTRLLRRMDAPEAFMRLLGYAAIALVVGLALLIVAGELRAAGLLRGRRAADEAARDDREAGAMRAPRGDLGQAPLLERPGLLLDAIVDALVEARRLPPAGSLTAREITARAVLPEPTQRRGLAALAEAAERARFGAHPPPAEKLVDVLESGGRLLATLARAEPAGTAGAQS